MINTRFIFSKETIGMGSITQGEYIELKNELEERFIDIVFLNKYNLLLFVNKPRDPLLHRYLTDAILPKNYSNDFIFISRDQSDSILFCFGHYILKQVSPLEMREFLLEVFKNKISHGIRPLQRKWKEYYYHPEGPYLKKNLETICEKNGFNK